jgi:hypothetical protein
MLDVSSTIALIALGASIPVMVGLFFVMRPVTAALVVALGAEMFLPELVTFKLPLLPPLDKHNLPYLCILLGCLVRYPGRVTKLPKPRWIVVLALGLLVGGVVTALGNGDPLVLGTDGQVYIPALTVKDGFYMGIANFFESFLPLYLGYALFRKAEDFERLLVGLAVACLVYVPLAMVELRLSPQWHRWVYGYAQHDFIQTVRWGGYRPMVFMSHGLALARFFLAGTCCLVILSRYRRVVFGLPIRFLAWTQFLVLLACKSTGAIVFGLLAVPLLAFTRPKRQLLFAAGAAVIIVLYPTLRLSGVFPVARLLEAAGAVQPDRADSLAYRFANEDRVLERARQRILFGWGEYDRNAAFDEEGHKTSVLDGYWIIRMSTNGLAGFVFSFAPLLLPVFWARRRLPAIRLERDQRQVAGVALLLAFLAFDLIPNGLWAFYPFLIAGALIRRLQELRAEAPEPVPVAGAG